MKYLILIMSAFILFSCKEHKTTKETTVIIRDTIPSSCNFGMQLNEFNHEKRTISELQMIASKRGGNKPVRNPPPSNASGKILFLLDFNGYTVSGTSWNVFGDINCTGAGLAPWEEDSIYNIEVKRYEQFNGRIIFTTNETDYNNWSGKKQRIIYTQYNEWYSNGAGGTSYVGSASWSTHEPCFVFTKLLGYSLKKIGEAGAHEAGHTLGLYHQAVWSEDCITLISEYNYGTGNWAPIMGVGYGKDSVTLTIGHNPYSCVTWQDDTLIIHNTINSL